MKRIYTLLIVIFSLSFSNYGFAQEKTISGKVTSKTDGALLPGVSVIVQGTTKGTETDFDGEYTIKASVGDVLSFSYLGMKEKKVTVSTSNTIDVVLEDAENQLDEIVVTAFGVKREAKKLGYVVEEVKSTELTKGGDFDVANALRGKLTGVDIKAGATGPGSSANITIRGITSLSGNNQPLIVVDGVIVSNSNVSQGDFAGGFDTGNGLSNLNPDDIERVSVLKAGNATALYGYLGAGGVILITTKSGKTGKVSVTLNSSSSFENVLVSPKLQNQYGQGRFNTTTNQLEYNITDGGSWGPKLDGTQKLRFDGVGTAPYSASPGDFKDFYTTGTTFNNAINVSQRKEKFNYKLSYARLDNESIQRGTKLKKHNFGFKAGLDITDKIRVSAKLDYIKQNGENRPELTDGQSNTVKALSLKPRNISNRLLQNNYLKADGLPNTWTGSFTMNPYYTANTLLNEDELNRYLSLISLEVDVFESLKANLKISQDAAYTNAFIYRRKGAFDIAPNGKLDEFNTTSILNSYDFLLNYNKNITEDFNLTASVGLNHISSSFKSLITTGETFVQDNFFSFNNFVSKNINPRLDRRNSNSIYGTATLGYKNYAFLELTARNDWSSSLPLDNASFFYPSVGASVVLSDAFPEIIENSPLTFLKLRGGYAKTGNATDAYNLQNTYKISSGQYNNQLFYFFGNSEEGADSGAKVKNPNLIAEISTNLEFGLDARFFNDRLRLNATYYKVDTDNQIIELSLPPSGGADKQVVNAGLITNKGLEISISGDIVKSKDFTWTADLNFSKNESKIEELAQDVDVQVRERQFNDVVQVGGKLGESLWTLFGSTYERDDSGKIIYDSDGLPKVGGIDKIGTTNPDALANLRNTFTYKNFSLSVLLDAKFGGDLFSFSDLNRATSGTDVITLEGREYFTGGNGFMVPNGAVIDGTLDPDVVARGVNPQSYWGRLGQISERWVQDASFIKLREVSLNYNFTGSILEKLHLSRLSIGYFGRNLAILHKNTDNFDPETGFNNSFAGVEYFGFPSTSSHGLKLNIAF
ncbi:SusC/RagA family TonB-linked outer membrane protein [Polaribacter cellanae]|uniref:SusC/RagA family TonB-linked outer membrane protein n=1 Tax=Polaribacter cellanae TaxID=2818493 RepID=A0A975H5C6_9FLAO|nr:SusC/RagA family TonB-linked outer membrane protein [Polaribacter cellanae]QTE21257.1 SusC/RagA family TonB-linked outer membrane protein [Polaribacter cellanae]